MIPLKNISFVILRTDAESITSVFATLTGFCDFAQNDEVGTFQQSPAGCRHYIRIFPRINPCVTLTSLDYNARRDNMLIA
ncbi:MAG: hypothetical protein LBD23_04125 [Oscillospiraceae bacterium]|nr:hypothetical protein [Oscillospiraceae bacterium]